MTAAPGDPAAGRGARPVAARPGRADGRRRAAGAAAGAAAVDAAARLRQRAALPGRVRRRGRAPRRLPRAGRPGEVPDHQQGRSARQLPVRHVRRPAGAGAPRARLQRHDRPADRRRLHRARHRHLGHRDGPLDPRGRRPGGGQAAQRLRLRAVHRRARRALRRGEARLHGHPRLRRHDPAPGAADPGLRAARDHGDAVLHAHRHRRVREAGHRPRASSSCKIGIFGAEPWTEQMRQRDGGAPRHRRRSTSTACRR